MTPSMDIGVEEGPFQWEIRHRKPVSPIIETDQTLPRTGKPTGSLGEISSMPYGARIHRRVSKVVLPKGAKGMLVWRDIAKP